MPIKHIGSRLNQCLIHWHNVLYQGYWCDISIITTVSCLHECVYFLISVNSIINTPMSHVICLCICKYSCVPWEQNCLHTVCVWLCMQEGDNVHVCWSTYELKVTLNFWSTNIFFSLTSQFSWKKECQTTRTRQPGLSFKARKDAFLSHNREVELSLFTVIFLVFLDNIIPISTNNPT